MREYIKHEGDTQKIQPSGNVSINPTIKNTWHNERMKIDARKLPREDLEEKRRMTRDEIVEARTDTVGRRLKLDNNISE